MASETLELHSKYIKNYLINEILEKLDEETLDSYEFKDSGGLDGFMSAVYNIQLTTKTADGSTKERLLLAKFMKGDEAFRQSSKAYTQFENEIYIYATVLPEYEKILEKAQIPNLSTKNWAPPCYIAKFGYIEGLSKTKKSIESVLVLENLKPHGYKLGPRLYLTLDQLYKMCDVLGEYHAMSYVLQESNKNHFFRLAQGIKTLPFIHDETEYKSFYDILYRLAFDRFYEFFERKVKDVNSFNRKDPEDLLLVEYVNRMKEKFFKRPTELLELLRTQTDFENKDQHFLAILHGDFNRNNVLFHFKDDSDQEVDNIKMIDFQELRFASPAIDLSFFMYFNSTKNIRENHWQDLLKRYHSSMFQTLGKVLQTLQDPSEVKENLKKYNFENFVKHFSCYALYGVLICLHFMPWLLCSEEECSKLSLYFEKDMYGEEFRKISLEAGGDDVNEKLLDIVKHASRLGYLDFL